MDNHDSETSTDIKQLLLLEYEQACEDWRSRDSMLWQTLSILITVSGVASTIALSDATKVSKAPALYFALIFNLIALVKIVKDHYYQNGTKTYLSCLAKKISSYEHKELINLIYTNDCYLCESISNKCLNPRHHHCVRKNDIKIFSFYSLITDIPAFKLFFTINLALIIFIIYLLFNL